MMIDKKILTAFVDEKRRCFKRGLYGVDRGFIGELSCRYHGGQLLELVLCVCMGIICGYNTRLDFYTSVRDEVAGIDFRVAGICYQIKYGYGDIGRYPGIRVISVLPGEYGVSDIARDFVVSGPAYKRLISSEKTIYKLSRVWEEYRDIVIKGLR